MGARGRREFAAAFAATLALLAATLLAPTPAYASIEDDVNGWMCGVLRDCANWIFGAQAKVLASIGVDGVYLSMRKSTLRYVDDRHFDSGHTDRFTRGRSRHVATAPTC